MPNFDELEHNFEKFLIESDDEHPGAEESDQNEELSLSEYSTDDEQEEENVNRTFWSGDIEANDNWSFDDECGFNTKFLEGCFEPIDFFELFFNRDIIGLIVVETNRYGSEKNQTWVPTNSMEIRKFIGLCLQMSIVRLPHLRDYWSTRPVYGGYPIGTKIMTRNRFESLLSSLHLADNSSYDGINRLYKISPFLDLLNTAFQSAYKPGKKVCIDESLVPFRGRIIFKQYIPNKRHRYGIKLFKLCAVGGYTSKVEIYAGKDTSRIGSVASSVVLRLMNGLLDHGRILYTDNWYSSVPLAEELIQRKTHLVGTIKKNRKGLPKEVIDTKLKRGMSIARQNPNGVTVMKWVDKREIFMLSTLHDNAINQDGKPVIVEDYNSGKMYVDISDQMAAYTPFLRRTTKWYIRLFFHLLTQTALVNSWRLYCDNVNKVKLNDFKIEIIESLLENDRQYVPKTKHWLEELDGPKALSRKRCHACYNKMSKTHGYKFATAHAKKNNTRCSKCKKHFCLECFQKKHAKCD